MSYVLKVGNNGMKKFKSLASARKYAKQKSIKRVFIAKATKGGFKIFR